MTLFQEVTDECKIRMSSSWEDSHARKTVPGSRPSGKEIHTLQWQQWEMFSTDLLRSHPGRGVGHFTACQTHSFHSGFLGKSYMSFLLPTESEFLLPALKQREVDGPGALNDNLFNWSCLYSWLMTKKTVFASIHISKLRYRRKKRVQENTFILQTWICHQFDI